MRLKFNEGANRCRNQSCSIVFFVNKRAWVLRAFYDFSLSQQHSSILQGDSGWNVSPFRAKAAREKNKRALPYEGRRRKKRGCNLNRALKLIKTIRGLFIIIIKILERILFKIENNTQKSKLTWNSTSTL